MNNIYTLEVKNPDGKVIAKYHGDLDEGEITAQLHIIDSEDILQAIYDDEYERTGHF